MHCITTSSARQRVRSASRAGIGALLITLSLACGVSFAQQGPIQGTPNADSPRQSGGGGGGVGIGINIDLGSVINLLRDRNKKDQKCDPEVEQGARSQYARAPLPGMTVEQFVAKSCEEHTADSLHRKTVITALSAKRQSLQNARSGATCKVNGDFESGSFSSWTGANNGIQPRTAATLPLVTTLGINSGALNLDTSHQTIVTAGNDPNVGAALQQVRPGGGGKAALIGNTYRQYGAELLAKSFTVTPADAIVGFSYAVVLEDGGHSTGNPKFMVRVLDSSGTDITNNISGGRVHLSAVSGAPTNELIFDFQKPNPFFQKYPGGYWKDWSCAEIDLSDLVGQDVTIEFITQDCNGSAHYGYAYIDDFCATCGKGPEGSITLSESSKCGVGKVCVDVTVPKAGNTTGQATASLDIWQNGVKLTTYSSPAISADGKVCFPINPSTIPGLDMSKGFDYSAQASMTIMGSSGPYTLPTKLLGAGPDGLQPGRNNDYTPTCTQGPVCGLPGLPPCPQCGTPGAPPCPACGQEGQPLCPACGQVGQPLCVDSCLAVDYAKPGAARNNNTNNTKGTK